MKDLVYDNKMINNANYPGDINSLVQNLKFKYLSLWWETECSCPKINRKISFFDKLKNERKVEVFRKKLFKLLNEVTVDEEQKSIWRDKILELIKEFESNISGYEESLIDFFIDKGYSEITEAFIDEAKKFDSSIEVYDIFQAIRNVWIMNSIQIFYDMRAELTPSIFAYSMLYPYSDNYLDDTNISVNDKRVFNDKFRKWLLGEQTELSNLHEKNVYNLVQKIEGEFPRPNYSQVFESLLSIHSAQEKSLVQQRGASIPYERDILGISFEKGGTSVLTDSYLVRGELTEEEADFMFGYGVFLQLIDDLQDVEEDIQNGHMTTFSQMANKWTLDRLVNKLLWFIENVLDKANIFSIGDSAKLKKVIYESCIIMIFEAVSKNKKMFSRKYIRQLEEHSMLRFSYYRKVKRKFKKRFSSEGIIKICEIFKNEKN
ncbi:hypothetical protein [Brassicibacter mesophilus]|uniref:hypothetical protein n=1 Tax=Brassicibacter mesophilus TaxID=745119 RepID=UPI003D1BA15A